MGRKNLIIISAVTVVIVILVLAIFYFVRKANQKETEIAEMVEQMNFEKAQVEKEYSEMALEFGGYTSNIRNDSLVQLLQEEKIKVQQLLEELRMTKSTNARRIAELRAELAAVRRIMVHYVNQIDSLNSMNKALKTENVAVQRKYQAAAQTVQELSKEKESLSEVVTRASILEVTNFSMIPLNNKNKKASKYTPIENLQFNFTITKNITAQPGEKTLYLRITRPDDDVLTKSPGNTFTYENKQIAYSAAKKFEYTGDAISDALYWKVGEILPKGTYRAEFFADGNRIGSFTFTLDR